MSMQQVQNPLARTALSVPAGAAQALSYGARSAGVLLAAAIAVSEDYDGSQVFGSVLALLVLATMVPLPASIGVLGTPFRAWLPWLGAGFVFFGGAMLGSIGLGLLMMPVGVAALIGAAMVNQHEGDSPGWGILAFFAGFVILLGFFFVVLLPVVEG